MLQTSSSLSRTLHEQHSSRQRSFIASRLRFYSYAAFDLRTRGGSVWVRQLRATIDAKRKVSLHALNVTSVQGDRYQ